MSKTEPIKVPCPIAGHEPVAYTATGRCVECTKADAKAKPWAVQTREQAHAAGATKYYTGKVCVNGHATQRYVSSGICIGCSSMNANKYQKGQRDKFRTGQVVFKAEVHPDDTQAMQSMADSLKAARQLQTGGPGV